MENTDCVTYLDILDWFSREHTDKDIFFAETQKWTIYHAISGKAIADSDNLYDLFYDFYKSTKKE